MMGSVATLLGCFLGWLLTSYSGLGLFLCVFCVWLQEKQLV